MIEDAFGATIMLVDGVIFRSGWDLGDACLTFDCWGLRRMDGVRRDMACWGSL